MSNFFNRDNYSNPGIEYDYDVLNEILHGLLPLDYSSDDIKNYSDRINNELYDLAGNIYYETIVVGKLV